MGATISGSYLQVLLQNKSATAGASTNYVLSNNLGTDSTYYGEFGMNSSVYSSGTPADFFSINNGVYFSSHDGDVTIGSGNGFKTYFAWGTAGQSAHVINASGAIGLNTSITGSTNFGTANYVMTSQGSSATPTWSQVSLTAGVTGTLPIANGGTGQTTASAAFNALSPITTTGDLIIGNGTNSATRLAIGANTYVLTSNGTTATWAAASGGAVTISNDTTTSSNIYPLSANATSGTASTVYTSNAKFLYKPSTGELTAPVHIASNGLQVNSNTVSTSYSIPSGSSAMSAGPMTVASGQTVTIPSGSRWVVL